MAKNKKPKIDEKKFYKVSQTTRWLRLKAETIKAKCRSGEIKGTQVGARKEWHIRGSEIISQRKILHLDEIEG